MFEKYTSENPYFIAEIGVNHEGSIERAKRLIVELAKAGAHCAKFQTYKAEKLAAVDSPAYWDQNEEKTETQFKLFKKLDQFSDKDYSDLSAFCKTLGIDFLSTPFDLEAVASLASLMKFYKIASADITNMPLIKLIAKQKKPVVMSTGAASLKEIMYAVAVLEKYGAPEICLLHCVLNYPTPLDKAYLSFIKVLKKEFSDLTIGYSDHVKPDVFHSALSVALENGATLIEKHYTYDKTLPGNDHYHAFDLPDFISFKKLLEMRQQLNRDIPSGRVDESEAILNARRSVYTAREIQAGQIITEDDLICLRPGSGISPIDYEKLIGSKVNRDLPSNYQIRWEDMS